MILLVYVSAVVLCLQQLQICYGDNLYDNDGNPILHVHNFYVTTTTTAPVTAHSQPHVSDDDTNTVDLTSLKNLYSSILSNYNTHIRPTHDQAREIRVNTLFVLTNIIEFDTTSQKLSILAYIRVYWKDPQITWAAEDYTGLNNIRLPLSEIWYPKLSIVEEFDGRNYIGVPKTDRTKITWEGDIEWVPEGMYSVVCEVDIQYYPYDEQTCTFIYYVSGETNTTVLLDHADEVKLDEYIENTAWKLVEIKRIIEKKWDTHFINIKLKLQRRAHFATFTIVTPLLMLAFLNIGVFIIPSGSGEKSSFAITIFLSYGIFITIVSDTLPHNSLQISYFVILIITLLSFSVLSVLYAVIQAKLMSAIGKKECNVKLRCLRGKRNDGVESIGGDDKTGSHETTGTSDVDKFTWGMAMEKVDGIICVVLFVVLGIITGVIFHIMVNHVVSDISNA